MRRITRRTALYVVTAAVPALLQCAHFHQCPHSRFARCAQGHNDAANKHGAQLAPLQLPDVHTGDSIGDMRSELNDIVRMLPADFLAENDRQ